jgi:anti-sigma factor RsiW
MLSEYIDNTLSARDMLQVEAHVADCNACARSLNEMRQTVRLVAELPRFEVGADFMQSLQTRLAAVEPEPSRPAWIDGIRQLFRPRAIPVWGAAVCGAVLVAVIPRPSSVPGEGTIATASSGPSIVQTARNQSVALAAANPLGDPAAAALMAANVNESGESTSVTQ